MKQLLSHERSPSFLIVSYSATGYMRYYTEKSMAVLAVILSRSAVGQTTADFAVVLAANACFFPSSGFFCSPNSLRIPNNPLKHTEEHDRGKHRTGKVGNGFRVKHIGYPCEHRNCHDGRKVNKLPKQ